MSSAYPTANGSPKHALTLFIDGGHPEFSTREVMPHVAALARMGTTFSNARVTLPSDSMPGILGRLTGAPGPPASGDAVKNQLVDVAAARAGAMPARVGFAQWLADDQRDDLLMAAAVRSQSCLQAAEVVLGP